MRGTVAKRIRKEARTAAAESPTKFGVITKVKKILRGGKSFNVNRDTLKFSGFRRIYQDMKKAYKG